MYITGSNLPFVWFFTESGSSKSGLTPKIQHLFRNGIEFMGASGSVIAALGGGTYRFLLSGSNVNVVGDYEAVAFITGTADMNVLPCRLDVENPALISSAVWEGLYGPYSGLPGTFGWLNEEQFGMVGSLPSDVDVANAVLDTDVTLHTLPSSVGLFIGKIFSLDDTIEGTLTLRKIIKLIASALFGKSFGGGTANVGFRDTQDTKNRISATVDANGNRTNVILDGS